MKEYLASIILTSVLVGLVEIMAPNGNGLTKYVKMLGLLIICAVIISPFSDFLRKLDGDALSEIKDSLIIENEGSKEDYEEILKDYLNRFSVVELENELSELLCAEFGVTDDESEIVVYSEHSDNGLELKKIQILLSGKSVFKNPYEIEKYFNAISGCECEVLIKQGG